jgi:serine/threonine-protein kinase
MSNDRYESSTDRTRIQGPDEQELYCPTCDTTVRGRYEICATDGTKLVRLHADRDPMLGRNIDGRFLIKSQIGAGGMGAVYLAVQGSIGREVAVKVIEPRRASGRIAAKRFLREAKLSSRLQQANTVTVLDFGQTEEGLLYLVMELVKGRTLNDVLTTDGPFSIARMVAVGVQMCDALEAAHRLAIIHRDLKPSNVILLDEPAGRDHIKVLDFGLAKSLAGEHESMTMTQSDAIVGTPSYIPPESVLRMQFDARSDLYSLGVMLYELIAGRLPFAAESVHMMLRQHAYDAPQPLPDHIPRPVHELFARLLDKDPERRIQSAAEVRAELLACADLDGVSSSRRGSDGRGFAPTPRPPSLSRGASVDHTMSVSARSSDWGGKTRPTRWWLYVASAVLAAVVALVVLPSGRSTPTASSTTVAPGAPGVAAPRETAAPPAPTPAATPPAATAATTNPPAEPAVAVVELQLDSRPRSIVWVDGERLGPSPQSFRTARSATKLELRFEKAGYKTERIVHAPLSDAYLQPSLVPLATPRKPVRPKPAAATEPEPPPRAGPPVKFVP